MPVTNETELNFYSLSYIENVKLRCIFACNHTCLCRLFSRIRRIK